MNILLVNPTYPETFWSFKHALKFISKKASYPPLGLVTVAAMLPVDWPKKLIDMNVESLGDDAISWADFVFLGGMSIQKDSAKEVIGRCKALGRKIVAGGPLFTARHQEFEEIDHFVLNEAELTLHRFLSDIKNHRAERIYSSRDWADLNTTPIPLWKLVNFKHYSSMCIQYSRGCPYDCEFCDITVLYGRVPRTKTKEQLLSELESLYQLGWRGSVFFVDDNFIGNRGKLKTEILPAIIDWAEKRKHPFVFNTEASINLADDDELMRLMARAGFDTVFVGIESPNEESIIECKKSPNKNRDLAASVRRIQRFGLQVQGGFILGFDSDPAAIFERLIGFIKETGIVNAMVGLLNAPVGTKLYQRLMKEGRLLDSMSGDNTDFSINFIPKMSPEALIKGYKRVLENIYSPRQYYERVQQFLQHFKPERTGDFHLKFIHLQALVKSIVLLGMIGKERIYYWKLFFWSLTMRPRLFPLAITFAIYGHHFRKVFEQHIMKTL